MSTPGPVPPPVAADADDDLPPLAAYRLRWGPTPRLRRLALVAVLAIGMAVASGRGELASLAAAPLVLLVLSPRSGLPRTALAGVRVTPQRCLEDDELALVVHLRLAGADRVEVAVAPPVGVSLELTDHAGGDSTATLRWVVVPHRWGRQELGPVRLRLRAATGLYTAAFDLALERITVYPGGGTVARAVAPRELPARLGDHASRALGSGVEFGGVRPFATGDQRRDIDWRTSARHSTSGPGVELFVRQYADERAFDLVLLLDVGADAGEVGHSTLDLTIRGATGLATGYLRVHDRVGVVTLGGWTRWLKPDASIRQLHRIAETVMDVRGNDTSIATGVTNVPRSMLRPGTFVVVFTPMLDRRALDVVTELCARGIGLLVIDVLTSEPDVGARTGLVPLALRLWRLEREAVRVELTGLGVPLLRWDGSGDLSAALLHAMRAVPPGVRA